MLKVLKWAYDLGVRQERVRISAHLQNVSRQSEYAMAENYDMLRNDKTSKQRKVRAELNMEVDRRIKETIDAIMRPQSSDYLNYSIMFPNDKHKGEK